jgi:hypothetical protein
MSFLQSFQPYRGTPIAFPLWQEGTMHIHGNSMAINAANFYSASQEERAAATRRAADVRRKLMKSASDIEGVAAPDEAFMVSHWMDAQHSKVQSEDQYHSNSSGRDTDFE